MGIRIALRGFLRRLRGLLWADAEGAYADILQGRHILVPFLVVCLFEVAAGILTAQQQAADSVAAMLANPLVAERVSESVAYEVVQPTATGLTSVAAWRVLWISVEIVTTALGLAVVGMVMGRTPDFWGTVAIVTNARLIPSVIGKLVEVPLAWHHDSVFYAQVSLGPLLVDFGSLRPIHHFLFEMNLFFIWRAISMAEGMSVLWKLPLRASLVAVFGVWLLKITVVTAYLQFLFGGLFR